MKIDAGPGYRIYFMRFGQQVYLLLAGSDKKAQQQTIALAKELARSVRVQKKNEEKDVIK